MSPDCLFESLPSQWEVTTLGDVCARSGGNVQTGPFGSQLHASDYVPSGIPSIMPENLGDERISTAGIAYIRQDDAERLSRYLVRPGDIVYSRRGDVTKRALVGKEHDGWLCGTGCLRVRFGKGEINPRFAFYYLGHPLVKGWISRHAIGATLPNLNTSILLALPFLVPPRAEQEMIAAILSALDDKIELNRRMNETLEAMARAIFKSWFIDFDPVRRNLARRGSRNQPSPQPSPKGRGSFRGGYDFAGLLDTARELRSKQTPAEEILWQLVRNRRFMGLKFRRQHQIGDYIADFYCHDRRLVVELDGGVHSTRQQKDHKRDAWLEARGYHVMRFSNNEVLEDPQSVLDRMAQAVIKVGPFPLAEGLGEGPVEQRLPSPAGRRDRDEGSVEELDRLFPDSFQDSPLGKIPRGWRVGKLSELCTTQYGYTASATEEPIGPKFLRVTDINKRNWIEWDSVPHCRIGEEDKSRYSLAVGDIVVARMADPGKSAIIEEQVDAVFASYLVRLKTCSLATACYVYGFLKSQAYEEYSQGALSGSVQANMNAKVIVAADLVIPPTKLNDAYAARVLPLRRLIVGNLREASTLAAIRDTLLPKLISGEIRLREVDQICERGL